MPWLVLWCQQNGEKKVVNQEALDKIDELSQEYKNNWGREPDFICQLGFMTQEDMVVVLERIVETGESVLVGWNKCFLTGGNK